MIAMNDAIWYLLGVASNYHIDVQWAGVLSPYTPPACRLDTRIVCMNSNWHRPGETAFQLAHELSHIINGDSGDACFYDASFTSKSSVEYKANVGAVKLLVPFYCQDTHQENINVCNFEVKYDIPGYLSGVVNEEVKKYYANEKSSL